VALAASVASPASVVDATLRLVWELAEAGSVFVGDFIHLWNAGVSISWLPPVPSDRLARTNAGRHQGSPWMAATS